MIALSIGASCAAGVACSSKNTSDQHTLFVSILPLRCIVEGIVGDDYPIEVLVPPGASPETFEPTPRQFAALNRAQLVFNVGLIDFESSLIDKVADRKKVVDLSRGIPLIEGCCAHSAKDPDLRPDKAESTEKDDVEEECRQADAGHSVSAAATERHAETGRSSHNHGIDPHVWTSPKALIQMAENAFLAIHERFPDSLKYVANFQRLRSELHDLDARTAAKIDSAGVRRFFIYHPALTYFARDYGLDQVAIEADGKEPSARHLARIIRLARRDGTRKIFYQSQFPESVAEVVARDMGAECVAIDPLREEVIENIDAITDQIVRQ